MTRCPHPGCATPTQEGACGFAECPRTKSFSYDEVRQAIEDEVLTGEITPELYLHFTADLPRFMLFCHQMVDITRRSIADRMGVEVACECGKDTCTGWMKEGCGHAATIDQIEMLIPENPDEPAAETD